MSTSAHRALNAFFKAKKAIKTAKQVENVYAYGRQVQQQKKGDSEWDTLKQDTKHSKIITQAGKGVVEAVEVFKKAVLMPIEWPQGNVSKYFECLAKSAPFYGPNSDEANYDLLNFISVDNNFHFGVRNFRSEYQARLKHIQKHLRIAKASKKYATLVQRAFIELAKYPTAAHSTAPQYEWVTISENALQHAGKCDTCVTHLSALEKTHLKAIKAYSVHLKIGKSGSAAYKKILTSDDPADFDKFRKILDKQFDVQRKTRR
ncbi:MAG: hypothetical protein JKY31_11555 [Rhodobacteraceae bacterium]|nr:hypothetical protein [Paracoccaceae bacterium]